MFNKIKVTTASLLVAASMTSAAQAQEVSLHQFVGQLVSAAVTMTQQEVRDNLEVSIVRSTNAYGLPKSRVTITDLALNDKPEGDNDKAE
ncbi:hypothetical protein [Bowmanella dokdonensis]|uniref:Uncharacterized protein n=1 Tax=Bowmanella dokdonensis TaxID=751969 RepID=A0A939DRI7_9ALTE|nr:hypothetical protein [Bowmanella dokdonensis]MBN7827424.1 hypothetical protein [Bowmanella dokdonensis]